MPKYLIVEIAGDEFGISTLQVTDILTTEESTTARQTFPLAQDVTSLRGCIVPVVDLRTNLTTLAPPDLDRSRIVVARIQSDRSDRYLGLVVDRIVEVRLLTSDMIEDPQGGEQEVTRPFVRGMVKSDRRNTLLLDTAFIRNHINLGSVPVAGCHKLTVTLLQEGLVHHRAGRLVDANQRYASVLEIEPSCSDALNLSGIVARQQGDLDASERLISQAIVENPSIATYHHNLGRTYALQSRQGHAMRSYRRALSLNPRDVDSLQMLADLLRGAGELEESIALYTRLLSIAPGKEEAYYNLGYMLKSLGDVQQGLEYYRTAAALFPGSPDSHFNLAKTLFEVRQLVESTQCYRQVLLLNPTDAEAYNCLGRVLHERGEVGEARKAYIQAIRLNPNLVEALSNLGALYMDMGDMQVAEVLLRRAVELDPGFMNAHGNLGSVLARQGRSPAAIDSLRTVLLNDPHNVPALCTLGFTLDTLGDEAGSLRCYDLALKEQPASAVARFNRSPHLLLAGNFVEGWREYEERWNILQFAGKPREFVQPRWQGEDVDGSRMYIYAEQGYGDTLQFIRYVLMLVDRGAEVILEVQAALYRLLQAFHPSVHVVIRDTEPILAFQWHCPLMSLAGVFETDLHNIPASIPYVHANAGVEQDWARRLAPEQFRVGVVWSGNPEHTRDRLRSLTLSQMRPIIKVKGAMFYSLQKGRAVAQVKETLTGNELYDLDPHLGDFTDTAGVVANLDLVITVDTAVAHLAGAMGKPVWVLLAHTPDWRWLKGRSESPWYPTAKLFRQTAPGQWADVLIHVQHELETVIASQGLRMCHALC